VTVRLIAIASTCAIAASTAGSAGSLDPSFGHGGRVFVSLSDSSDTANDVAVQPDGKVLVAGRVGGRFAVVRFDSAGRLDRQFGRNGLVREELGEDPEVGPVRVAVQRNGRIVLAAATSDRNDDNQLGDSALAVYRLLPGGRADPSFGRRGVALVPRKGDILVGFGLAIAGDGRIVVATRADSSRPTRGVFVVRLKADGKVDRTFGRGGNGSVTVAKEGHVANLAVDPRGRILLAGGFGARGARVARLTAAGDLDPTFGRGGLAQAETLTKLYAEDFVLRPDGRLVMAGEEVAANLAATLTLAGLTADGSPDRTFGTGGVLRTHLRLAENIELGIVLQRDGKILVAGGLEGLTGGSRFLVARLDRNGAFDRGFGGQGYTTTVMRSAVRADSRGTAVALAPDGRIVVAGRSARDKLEGGTSGRIQYRFAVARYFG
jgi:uncharacterized delta-60 repeat protein